MCCFVDLPAIFLYKDIIDFRKSIKGLVVIIEQELDRSAFDPAFYGFWNCSRDKLEILYWHTTEFVLWFNLTFMRLSVFRQKILHLIATRCGISENY